MSKLISALFLCVFLFSCSPDEESSDLPDPEVVTGEAVVKMEGGVELKGILPSEIENIINHGFRYSEDNNFTTGVEKIELGKPKQAQEYKAVIEQGLKAETTYYYSTFAATREKEVYGTTGSFKYLTSSNIKYDSLSAYKAYYGDTLFIYGKNFTFGEQPVRVYLDTKPTATKVLNDSVISFEVSDEFSVVAPVLLYIGEIILGGEKLFLHKPEIEKIIPEKGNIGDTIMITGNHFDYDKDRSKVFFGDVEGKIITTSRKELKVMVPAGIRTIEVPVRVEAQGFRYSMTKKFSLLPPVIEQVDKFSGTFGEEIIITGDNFDSAAGGTEVFFSNVPATLVNVQRQEIRLKVPDNASDAIVEIKVVSQFQEAQASQPFYYLPPVIEDLPLGVKAEEIVNIIGKNFHPHPNGNKVTFEGVKAEVKQASGNQLSVKVPYGPFPRGMARVEVEVLGMGSTYDQEVNITDNWVMISDALPFTYYRSVNGAVSTNGYGYTIAGEKGDYTTRRLYLWKFDPIDFSWAQIDIPSDISPGAMAALNGKIYVYAANQDKRIWEYNPESNQWSEKAAFPGERRDRPVMFAANGAIYLGIGADFLPYMPVFYQDLFKYNPNTDDWAEVESHPQNNYSRAELAVFVHNGTAYIGNGARTTGDVDFWAYKAQQDQWERLKDLPDVRNYTSAFELNGKGYITGESWVSKDNMLRYDPIKDQWEDAGDFTPIPRKGHFTFVINGRVYAGGGGIWGGGSTGYDLYQFIP